MEQQQQTPSAGLPGAEGSERQVPMVHNPGNPVITCPYPPEVYLSKIGGKLPVLGSASAQSPGGYGGKNQHPMYTTTAKSYGYIPPSICTVPTQFFAKSQKFSEHLGQCGMYRNYSLNTDVDKSKV